MHFHHHTWHCKGNSCQQNGSNGDDTGHWVRVSQHPECADITSVNSRVVLTSDGEVELVHAIIEQWVLMVDATVNEANGTDYQSISLTETSGSGVQCGWYPGSAT